MGGSLSDDKPRLLLTVSLVINRVMHSLQALVDSGSEQNLISFDHATQLGLHLVPLDPPISARALNNQVFAQITHHTEPVTVITSGNHREELTFFALSSPDSPHIRLPLVKAAQSTLGLVGTKDNKLECILPF